MHVPLSEPSSQGLPRAGSHCRMKACCRDADIASVHLEGHATVDLQDVAQRFKPAVVVGPHHIRRLGFNKATFV